MDRIAVGIPFMGISNPVGLLLCLASLQRYCNLEMEFFLIVDVSEGDFLDRDRLEQQFGSMNFLSWKLNSRTPSLRYKQALVDWLLRDAGPQLAVILHSDVFLYQQDALMALLDPLTQQNLDAIQDALIARISAETSRQLAIEELPIAEAIKRAEQNNESFIRQSLVEQQNSGVVTVRCVVGLDSFDVLSASQDLLSNGSLSVEGLKLDGVSGAYWQGDIANEQLSRISVLQFANATELGDYSVVHDKLLERDHRVLGKQLGMFVTSTEVGRGLPLLTAKGACMRRVLERYIVDEELRRGYEHVNTPILGRKAMYETSGHWENYKDSIYPPMEINGEEYILRPMSCPHHFMIFAAEPRSYKDMPMRIAEIAPMYRRELSGELSGLIRVMGFHLADAHIFITPEQVQTEFKEVVSLIKQVIADLGIEDSVRFRVSLRGEGKDKYIDMPDAWETAEKTLIELSEELELDFSVEPGHAAFYGPKLDVQMKTISGKEETLFTNQIDLALARRFDITYTDRDDKQKTPWVIHRSSIGCLERTMAFLIEHYDGNLPTWLSPVQSTVLSVSKKVGDYADKVEKTLGALGLRVKVDRSNETLGKKIALARNQRIPYVCVVGQREAEEGTVSVTNRDSQEKAVLPLDDFAQALLLENAKRSVSLSCV